MRMSLLILRLAATAAVALWLTPISFGAKVGEFTGEDYLRQCTSANPSWKPQTKTEQEMAVFCFGYIEAAVTIIVLMDGRSYCLPMGTTPQDVLKATVAFMQAHPEQQQHQLASVMVAAVQTQWPCIKVN
jgi:Rap1a immunity proteins